MGAAGLIEIKRRLKSVESTRKITKAMGLVATSKLRKCRRELAASTEYADAAKNNIESLVSMMDDDLDISYIKENKSPNKLYVMISSDSGLCSGYNNNVAEYLENLISDEKENAEIIVVGNKGISFVEKMGLSPIAEYVDIPDIPTEKEIKVIYRKILELFDKGEISEAYVVYTDFISPIKQVVKSERLLPIEKSEGASCDQFIEPDIKVVFKKSLDIYLKGKLRNFMLSSRCSEQSARMNAMDGATSNADDILSSLNIKYNRIRQSMITQEITEIIGGSEVQK